MIISTEQKDILLKHNIQISENINDTLLAIDKKITEIGFSSNYSLNKTGLELQLLYDTLYNQN